MAILASDFSALLEHTRRVTFVEDRQAVLLSRERCRVFDADTGGGRRSASRHGTQEILLGAAVLA